MPARLDLHQRRDFVDLLRATVLLFGRHLATFLGVTLLVVVPAGVLLDGVWGGLWREGREANLQLGPFTVWSVVVPPLVTALHVRIVERLGEGVTPTAWRAVREAAGRVPAAVVTVTIYSLLVGLGLVALILPGIYLAVKLYFCAQAAVLERVGPVTALEASGRLVTGYWARCFGYLIASTFLLGLIPAILGELLGGALQDGAGAPAYFGMQLLVQAVFMSLTALFGTLLYFDLRLRQATAP